MNGAAQCTSMHARLRCEKSEPHGSYHRCGSMAWLTDEDGFDTTGTVRCSSTVRYDNGEDGSIQCEEDDGHRSAHRGDGMIWTGLMPIHRQPTPQWGAGPSR